MRATTSVNLISAGGPHLLSPVGEFYPEREKMIVKKKNDDFTAKAHCVIRGTVQKLVSESYNARESTQVGGHGGRNTILPVLKGTPGDRRWLILHT